MSYRHNFLVITFLWNLFANIKVNGCTFLCFAFVFYKICCVQSPQNLVNRSKVKLGSSFEQT